MFNIVFLNHNKMKITEIKNKFDKTKKLLSEYSMLVCLMRSMLREQKEHPEEFEEKYFENITKRVETTKNELDNLFK